MGSKYNFECFAYVQSNKYYNWIVRSLFSHSLNDKSLQVKEIHDLNNERSNI
jgi:hypothetical protein